MPQSVKFGHEEVSPSEKTDRIDQVFSSVVPNYNHMNDLMSFGIHRLWKQHATTSLDCSPDSVVLDLACGTGDLSQAILSHIPDGSLICMDPSSNMLSDCQQRLGNQRIQYIQAHAEQLPLPNEQVDRLMIAFGFRNFTNPALALSEALRVLKPGGKLVILEFNPPQSTMLEQTYHSYLKQVIPMLGGLFANDRASYQYLADSIVTQPLPTDVCESLLSTGFESVEHTPLTFGIVGLFEGYKC